MGGEQGSPVTLSVEVKDLGCPGLSATVFTRPAVIVQDVFCAPHRRTTGDVEFVLNQEAVGAGEVDGAVGAGEVGHEIKE